MRTETTLACALKINYNYLLIRAKISKAPISSLTSKCNCAIKLYSLKIQHHVGYAKSKNLNAEVANLCIRISISLLYTRCKIYVKIKPRVPDLRGLWETLKPNAITPLHHNEQEFIFHTRRLQQNGSILGWKLDRFVEKITSWVNYQS